PYRIVIDFERQGPTADATVARNTGRGAAPPRAGGPSSKPVDATAPARARNTPASQIKTAPVSEAAIAPTGDTGIAPPDVAVAPIVEAAVAPNAAPPIVPLDTASSATVPPAAPLPPSANHNGNFSLSRQLGLGIAKIVIDAGHGGHDPGAQARGITEAELTLDIALRLEKLLSKDAAFEVVMTRRTDSFVSLEERTA